MRNCLLTILGAAALSLAGCQEAKQEAPPLPPPPSTVTTVTADGVTIHGEVWFGGLDNAAPLVLLFHQGGGDARGEYAELALWLNDEGFRAIAWDLRAGGERFGGVNRTMAGLSEETPSGYCDAWADLEAALDYVVSEGWASQVVAWGSSYSASLVFRLAAEHPDRVAAVVALSPAGGGPVTECRARMWVDAVRAPVLVMRPSSEMALESSIEQRTILEAAGAEFRVIENGVHGSSMLVDARTEQDMSQVRASVIDWLHSALRPAETD